MHRKKLFCEHKRIKKEKSFSRMTKREKVKMLSEKYKKEINFVLTKWWTYRENKTEAYYAESLVIGSASMWMSTKKLPENFYSLTFITSPKY